MRYLLGRNHAMINRAAIARVPAFTPTNTGESALYNNSTGGHVIVVWDFSVNLTSTATKGYLLKYGKLTTAVGAGMSIIAGEAVPVGFTYKDDLASPDAIQGDYDFTTAMWENTTPAPLAVLHPGWSLIVVGGAATNISGGTFIYQWLYPDEYSYNARNTWYDTE